MKWNQKIAQIVAALMLLIAVVVVGGYVYLKSSRSRSGLLVSWQDWYKNYKLQRAKRKFQVYLKKRGSGDRDRWVN